MPIAAQALKNLRAMEDACGIGGPCITSLESWKLIYNAVPKAFRPALANFTLSDAAFARMRLTSAPLLITKVTSMANLPVQPSAITGLDKIIVRTGKSHLLAVALQLLQLPGSISPCLPTN